MIKNQLNTLGGEMYFHWKYSGEALRTNKRIAGITHSYVLDNSDQHYIRDGIEGSIYSRLEGILKEMSLHKNP